MSKKNSKKRYTNQHNEQLRREKEELEKKAARAVGGCLYKLNAVYHP
jgi:hypothetical protein